MDQLPARSAVVRTSKIIDAMPAGRPPKAETHPKRDRGYEFIVFAEHGVDYDVRQIADKSGRPIQELLDYFLWLADKDNLCRRKILGQKVPEPRKRLTWYASPAKRQRCIDLAWECGVYKDSVQHYCGLALSIALRTRTVSDWILFFKSGQHLVDRAVDFLEQILILKSSYE